MLASKIIQPERRALVSKQTSKKMESTSGILFILLFFGFTNAKMSSKLRKQLQTSDINYNGKNLKLDGERLELMKCFFSGVLIYSYGPQSSEFQLSSNHYNLTIKVSFSKRTEKLIF